MTVYVFDRTAGEAWHDAFASLQSSRSILEPRGDRGTRDDTHQIYQADLAKVKTAIDKLPKDLRTIGMFLYGPEQSDKLTNETASVVWNKYMEGRGRDFVESFHKTSSCIILCRASIEEARFRLHGEEHYSQRMLANMLCTSQSTVQRKWSDIFETFVDIAEELGKDALTPIAIVCGDIHAEYLSCAA